MPGIAIVPGIAIMQPVAREGERLWTTNEERSLLVMLESRRLSHDLSNTYLTRRVFQSVARELSYLFEQSILYADVVTKIRSLRDRYSDFVWLKSTPGVSYDPLTNHVTVDEDEYNDHILEESEEYHKFREVREPVFTYFDTLFRVARMDTLDLDYLLQEFDGLNVGWIYSRGG